MMPKKSISFRQKDGRVVNFKGRNKRKSTAKSATQLRKRMSKRGFSKKFVDQAVRKYREARE